MKIKFGNDWLVATDSKPLMIVMSDSDKANISSMPDGLHKYALFDDRCSMSVAEKQAWMADSPPAADPKQ